MIRASPLGRTPPPSDHHPLGRRAFILAAGTTGLGLGLGITGCSLFDDGPERIDYGSAPSQFGELHLPDGPGPWPVVVVLHGGSWQADQGLSIMDPLCGDLRGRGSAVWNIEYRRVGEVGGGYPGTLFDVGVAIDHLANIAEDHPIDLSRITLLGHSAGGTLALWAAGRPGIAVNAPGALPVVTPGAVVSLAAVCDLAGCAEAGEIEGACPTFLGGQPSDRPERYAEVSPIEQLPLAVPRAIVHGTADRVVPPSQSERYAAAAESAGDPVTLTLVEGANHFTLIEPDSDAWPIVLSELDRIAP